jgi:5-hydroxyisourate hydrolase
MSGISTHILDLAKGCPAGGVVVRLEREQDGHWHEVSRYQTDADGRVRSTLPTSEALQRGRYRLGFATGEYFRAQGISCFHPYIEVAFAVDDPDANYHVPLLISPYSYSTYRGS